MFKRKTLFILGAGASVPYGYPTGQKLIADIISDIENDHIFLPHPKNPPPIMGKLLDIEYYRDAIADIDTENLDIVYGKDVAGMSTLEVLDRKSNKTFFVQKLSKIKQLKQLQEDLEYFDPVSIDIFLSLNPLHAKWGKMMIVYSLLKREGKEKFKRNFCDDNWYGYFLNDILAGCADDPQKILSENDFRIVTFNYDVSLDYYLYSRLKVIESLNKAGIDYWKNIEKNGRIMHVYGQLAGDDELGNYGALNSNESKSSMPQEITPNRNKKPINYELETKRFLKACKNKDKIYLMHEERNGKNDNEDAEKTRKHYEKIKMFVSEAEEIIIIGFGFDRDNLDNIGLPNTFEGWINFSKGKIIKYLNYNNEMTGIPRQFEDIGRFVHIRNGNACAMNYTNKSFERAQSKTIICSTTNKIVTAYNNDFKSYLY